MTVKNIEMQDSDGIIYYPHTDANVVKMGSSTVYQEVNNKANASDVKILSSLSDIGLTIDDMTTDFGTNILKIIKAMGKNRRLVLYPYSAESNTNLYNSVKTWCGINTDAYTLIVNSSFNGAENLPNKIEVYPNTADGENRYCYSFYDNVMGSCKEVRDFDTGWLNLPLGSGITEDPGLTPQYRKIGNHVYIRGSVKNVSTGNTVVGTLPVGFRPMIQNHHYTTFTNTNAAASFNISTDGRIIYQGNSTNTFNPEWFVVITNNFII